MLRIFDITVKDLMQLLRERSTFLFFLIMPLAFTLLFGFAFGGFGGSGDPRLPVGFLDQDQSWLSASLRDVLAASEVIRLVESPFADRPSLQAQVADEKLAGALIIPSGWGQELLHDRSPRLALIADTAATAGMTVESEALSAVQRVQSAARAAVILERVAGEQISFDYTYDQALSAWQEPPIRINESTSSVIQDLPARMQSLVHSSPGMMLQFAIAGLLVCAQVLVSERKSHALQRLFTTATSRLQVLSGHYLAILFLICSQFFVLISFAQFVLGVNYLREPAALLMIAFTSALCIAALGLLIGVLAKTEEQAVIFSLVPMFLLAGLGGAMAPLDIAGETFQAIGHLSPIAWAMDGFKNISVRGLGVQAALLPSAALFGYALFFFVVAAWRLARSQEK